jgi:hypothetical protein
MTFAELMAGDKKGANDRAYASLQVESSGCVGGGPTDADPELVEETAAEVSIGPTTVSMW